MEINAKLDVGDNITNLVEKLAQQIGTTADKVFPWYVEQAYLQGLTNLWAVGIAFVLFLAAFIVAFKKADFDNGNKWAVLTMVSGFGLLVLILLGGTSAPSNVRKIMNPHFYAVNMLAEDIGRMRGR